MEMERDQMARSCVDGLCSVLTSHPDWLAEVRMIASGLPDLAPDVRWARATRAWAEAEIAAVATGLVPYPDALAAAIGYSSLLKGSDWDAVLDQLGMLADA